MHIPADSLWLMAPFELANDRPVVVRCGSATLSACRLGAITLYRQGFEIQAILKEGR